METTTIIIPENYNGRVTLIMSNVESDILTIDSNGIGYITRKTYESLRREPSVIEQNGISAQERIVGFSPSAFWGKGTYTFFTDEKQQVKQIMKFKSFEVVPNDRLGQKQYYTVDLQRVVDSSRVFWVPSD